jgi:DNA-binding winged helix-turn-helix (wHTH) protein/tetratricopeptide (TPR) repeat protein
MAPWTQSPQRIFRFDAFEADLWTGELRKNGVKLKIHEQPLKVLAMLLARPGELVTRDQLREGLWSNDTFVDFDRGLNTAVNRVRAALDDSAENPRFVETVGGRGYRFISRIEQQPTHRRSSRRTFALVAAPLLALLVLVLSWKWWSPAVGRASATNGKRAMAVVEIENLSQDPSLTWLGDGVVDLLTTDLAQAKNFDVISSERVRSLISQEVGPNESLPPSQARRVAQKAGADVFVSGGLLKMNRGFRLNLRVQDTTSGKLLLADKVEGDSPQAIFSMVDQATEHIVSHLTPAGAGVQPTFANPTSNLDALHAYEEGVNYKDRVLNDRATVSFRRATDLDPEFAMAYYQLSLFLSESRERSGALAKAAQLAQRQGLPEQEKLLILGTQLYDEGRWEESTQTFQIIVRDFPKEVEPRVFLGDLLKYQGKLSEAAAVLETAAQLDPKRALIYNSLAYTYAYQGDLSRALEAVDKYAADLPPNDPNPIDTRADVYALNKQFDKAIAEYKRNVELHPSFSMPQLKISLVYLLSGKNRQAEETAQSVYRKAAGVDRASAANVLGDIALGRGAFSRAASYFTEAAQLFQFADPGAALRESRRVGEIYFEQREPRAALAWAGRTPGFGAAEIRSIAYFLSKNDLAAEKEFGAAHNAMAPVFGEFYAEKLIAFDRLRAVGYAGRWQNVIAGWRELPGWLDQPDAFFAGRAYAKMGMWPEAEKELRTTLIWVSPGNLVGNYSDFLCYELTQFYLGNVLEQEGKKAGAIEAYQAFLSHFEDSTARLPEITEARAALHRLQ